MMDNKNQAPFLAGALFKWTDLDKLTEVHGRVFLLVECTEESEALDIRRQLLAEPELFVELVNTMRPWPKEIITVDHEALNECTAIKDIFPYESED